MWILSFLNISKFWSISALIMSFYLSYFYWNCKCFLLRHLLFLISKVWMNIFLLFILKAKSSKYYLRNYSNIQQTNQIFSVLANADILFVRCPVKIRLIFKMELFIKVYLILIFNQTIKNFEMSYIIDAYRDSLRVQILHKEN